MNIEELKLVLETIKTVSGDATTVAMWWIIGHYVLSFVLHVTMVVTAGFVVFRIARLIVAAQEWGAAGRRVARAWGGEGSEYAFYSSDSKAIDKAIAAANKDAK